MAEPQLSGPDAPHLVLLRDVDGYGLPFDPGFGSIRDLASDTDGRIYVADGSHNHIVVLDSLGNYLHTIGKQGPSPFEFNRGAPYSVEWIPLEKTVVAFSIGSVSLFAPNGDFIRSIAIPIRRATIAATPDGFAQIDVREHPFRVYDLDGNERHRFGIPFQPEDAQWKAQRDYLSSQRGNIPYGGVNSTVGVHYSMLPYCMEVAQDSLFVHPMVYRNAYRCWSIESGDMIWQLNLQADYWEPPTLYTYSTAGENELISWARDGRARIHERSAVTDMSWGGGYLFSAIWLEGDRNMRKPDRTTVTSPVTESRELADGIPTHAVVDILDLHPHWIASIPLDVGGPPMVEVMSNGHVVIAVNEPRPSLSIYRVVGLWRIKGL